MGHSTANPSIIQTHKRIQIGKQFRQTAIVFAFICYLHCGGRCQSPTHTLCVGAEEFRTAAVVTSAVICVVALDIRYEMYIHIIEYSFRYRSSCAPHSTDRHIQFAGTYTRTVAAPAERRPSLSAPAPTISSPTHTQTHICTFILYNTKILRCHRWLGRFPHIRRVYRLFIYAPLPHKYYLYAHKLPFLRAFFLLILAISIGTHTRTAHRRARSFA